MAVRAQLSRFVVISLTLFMSAFWVLTSSAQVWDEVGATEALTGQPYDWTGTAGIAYSDGELWYMDYDGENSPPAVDLVAATIAYRFPVSWYTESVYTFFEDNPGDSPFGEPMIVTVSVDAVAFEVATPFYDGYVVGLMVTYASSAGEFRGSEELEVFSPGDLLPDKQSARRSVRRLAATQSPSPTNAGPAGVELTCEEKCALTRQTARKNAFDNYTTHAKLCSIAAGAGAGSGCLAGLTACGWLAPPFTPVICCIGGGIIGTGLGMSACLYSVTELYESALRGIEREYRDCMLTQCGIVIADE
ncbi:MAG: hypothetical protein KF838_13690 [Phycisphaeraceae bacterium]|nr:MAG: hypothetical protein KF838_13690 [Phycisphaeraceae bacterium]